MVEVEGSNPSPVPTFLPMTILTATEDELFALAVWREARGETPSAKLGVASVIRNRTKDPKKRWPRTIRAVILQPRQFSSFNPTDPNYTKFPAPDDPTWHESKSVVADVLAGHDDPTHGANLYHSLTPGKPWPKWAIPEDLTAHIGAFRFYKS
jgi:spore germination cell wall hydrolase CwlJ-like protein